jgi:hypothetical protein
MAKRSGTLKYSERAFTQDAEMAIQGDIIRALIELITNADDAYNAAGGLIEINVRKAEAPFSHLISIHDKAGGLTGEEMEKAFTNLGEQNTKFVEDRGTRGLFGRGAKDVAILGKAVFAAIKNGKYSTVEILANSKYEMEFFNDKFDAESLASTRLSTGESGLTSMLYIGKNQKMPSPTDLVEKLQKHAQLRDLINRNSIIYKDERNTLKITLKGLQPTGEKLIDKTLQVPGYEQSVHLTLYKLPTKEIGNLNEYSKHGILISGKGATYENSFLTLGSNPEIGWFCGRLDAPEIHDLAKAIDQPDGKTDLNPFRVVSRNRDGLATSHRYYRALSGAVESEVKPILEALAAEEGAQKREGKELRNSFQTVAASLAKTMQNLLDVDELGSIPSATSDLPGNQELEIIPPRRLIRLGETITLTVRVPDIMDHTSLDIAIENNDIVELITTKFDTSKWKKHPRINVVDKNIQIRGLQIGSTQVRVSNASQSASSQISVIDYELPPEVTPTSLQFAGDNFSTSPGKAKKILLLAPISMTGEVVATRTPDSQISVRSESRLRPSNSGNYSEGLVYVQSTEVEGTFTVEAHFQGDNARCTLQVKKSSRSKHPDLEIEVVGLENPPRRVDTLRENGKLVVRIYGQHKSIRGVLGAHLGSNFKNENTPQARATICEIVAQQLANYIVEREAETYPDRFSDAAMYFHRQQQHVTELVLSLQAGLITE